jgi:hypothetical protein
MKNVQQFQNPVDLKTFMKYNRRREEWSMDKFLNVPPYEINREVEHRVKKVSKNLSSGFIPGHVEVKIGRAMTSFGRYKKGDLFRLDGNTRAEVWTKFPNLIPPVNLDVTIYDFHSKEEADKSYYSIDSYESVETSSDKMTGLLREMDYNALTDTVKKGRFKSILNLACRYGYDHDNLDKNGRPLYLQTADIKDQLRFFKNELFALDNMGKSLDGKNNPKISMNVVASFLMIGKKYGINNPRFIELVNNYINEITEINDSSDVDGVHYVLTTLYTKNKNIWKYNGYSSYAKGLTPVICEILFAFDCFMNHQNLPKTKKILSDSKLFSFWQNYNG